MRFQNKADWLGVTRTVRSKAVFASGEVLIPPEFWRGISPSEFDVLVATNAFTKQQKRRLFRMLRRPVPAGTVKILVNRNDIDWMVADIISPPAGHA